MTEEPKKKKFKVIQSYYGNYEIFVRSQGLQHIAENIFGRLDLQSLLTCQIVCQSWNQFIKDEKSLWLPHLRHLKDGEMINVNYLLVRLSGETIYEQNWEKNVFAISNLFILAFKNVLCKCAFIALFSEYYKSLFNYHTKLSILINFPSMGEDHRPL